MTFVAPATHMQDWRCHFGKRKVTTDRRAAVARSLLIWIHYLVEIELMDWKMATRGHLRQFGHNLSRDIPPLTYRPCAEGTLTNQMSVVVGFYEYAAKKGWHSGNPCRASKMGR